jgi:DNA-binding MarR family transcriptional regulator
VGVELPTLVRLLNRMEEDGIVRRRLLVAERGAKTVVLTAKGRRAPATMRGVVVLLSQYATVVDWEDI